MCERWWFASISSLFLSLSLYNFRCFLLLFLLDVLNSFILAQVFVCVFACISILKQKKTMMCKRQTNVAKSEWENNNNTHTRSVICRLIFVLLFWFMVATRLHGLVNRLNARISNEHPTTDMSGQCGFYLSRTRILFVSTWHITKIDETDDDDRLCDAKPSVWFVSYANNNFNRVEWTEAESGNERAMDAIENEFLFFHPKRVAQYFLIVVLCVLPVYFTLICFVCHFISHWSKGHIQEYWATMCFSSSGFCCVSPKEEWGEKTRMHW